jgi:pyruvate dehydrogenase (quinone)
MLSADSGTTASWYAQHLRVRRGMMGSLSGNLATMGPGVPYAIAAKFAFRIAWPSPAAATERCK